MCVCFFFYYFSPGIFFCHFSMTTSGRIECELKYDFFRIFYIIQINWIFFGYDQTLPTSLLSAFYKGYSKNCRHQCFPRLMFHRFILLLLNFLLPLLSIYRVYICGKSACDLFQSRTVNNIFGIFTML